METGCHLPVLNLGAQPGLVVCSVCSQDLVYIAVRLNILPRSCHTFEPCQDFAPSQSLLGGKDREILKSGHEGFFKNACL